eukprot:GHRQ01028253.1.p2 GENE.GHRQ01028253.1~~GHRQ01028253.1.p2  ORF type:complete len:101 (+),score=2.83 GHRQ01028253.1:739-1041(+)
MLSWGREGSPWCRHLWWGWCHCDLAQEHLLVFAQHNVGPVSVSDIDTLQAGSMHMAEKRDGFTKDRHKNQPGCCNALSVTSSLLHMDADEKPHAKKTLRR